MAAGNNQRNGRVEDGLDRLDVVGADMGLDVIHCDERDVSSVGQRFAEAKPDEKGSYQTRPLSYCNGVDLLHIDTGLFQCGVDYGSDVSQVLPRRKLGDDSPVRVMDSYLRGDEIGEDAAAVLDNRRRSFIA
jgi:hypothetical protein